MSEESAKKKVRIDIEEGVSTATLNGTKIEISPEGNVVVFTNAGVRTKPGAEESDIDLGTQDTAATEDKQISIGKGFNTVAMYGAKVELATDGSLVVYTNGTVKVKPVPANDTAIQAALEVGATMADGSVFAGVASDGKQILSMPTDLGVTMTFNDAAKQVKRLNADRVLGHDDWVIPTKQQLEELLQNQAKGALKGTFTKESASGSDCPGWYWSSSEDRDFPSSVWVVRFSDGNVDWLPKGNDRLSCRPVRLVEACEAPSTASHSPSPG